MQPMPQQAPAPIQNPANQPPALPPGSMLLDRYLIQGYINGGGFGHIYKAQDTALGYRRAIKEAFYQDAYTRRQFQLEAEFLLNTRHANLVSAYAVFEQMGRLYLVMDFVSGRTLEEIAIDHIRRTGRTLPEAYVLDVVIPICGALHALHSAPVPVIHRDVKPANIKMSTQGAPILIDLGLAKLYAPGTQTIGAALAFTPGYAPPEQYRASGATDARTDVYGMGATLFYLLTGYQPTEAPARLGAQAIPAVRQLNPAISEATESLVIRAMELESDRRQQSATALESDLRAARAALGTRTSSQPTSQATLVYDETRQAATLICQQCGGENPPVARHCMRCGWRLVEDAQTPAMTADGNMAALAVGQPANLEDTPLPAWLAATLDAAKPDHAVDAASPLGLSASAGEVVARGFAEADGRWAVTPAAGEDRAEGPLPSEAAPFGAPPSGANDDGRATPDFLDESVGSRSPYWMRPVPAAVWLPGAGTFEETPKERRVAADAAPQPAHAARGSGAVFGGRRLKLPPRAQRQFERLAAFVGAISRPLHGVLPSPMRWQAATLSAAAPLDENEVRFGLAAVMAVVFSVVSLAAVWLPAEWSPLALLAAVPALALGHWCRWTARDLGARTIPEARWLATAGLIIAYAWLALYTVVRIALALHR